MCIRDRVITGIRRSGKSKLLEALRDYVEANLSNSNVIHINYNLDEFENLLEYHALLAYVKAVSYTHLDVYKRQRLDLGFLRSISSCATLKSPQVTTGLPVSRSSAFKKPR